MLTHFTRPALVSAAGKAPAPKMLLGRTAIGHQLATASSATRPVALQHLPRATPSSGGLFRCSKPKHGHMWDYWDGPWYKFWAWVSKSYAEVPMIPPVPRMVAQGVLTAGFLIVFIPWAASVDLLPFYRSKGLLTLKQRMEGHYDRVDTGFAYNDFDLGGDRAVDKLPESSKGKMRPYTPTEWMTEGPMNPAPVSPNKIPEQKLFLGWRSFSWYEGLHNDSP
ncbi:unnamed protein product [Amoebophrya sp. A120]|nr:unnamed protein product [Amoebophrya sp. A120]|eukprot:GSA120T00022477001.1